MRTTPGLSALSAYLRTFPVSGQLVGELALGHRRFRFQAHHIFYTEDGDHIVIRAIYHHSRAIRPELFS
jgi:toxin ParE1/3/4